MYIFPEWRCKRIIWRVAGCEQDGSLSYRMRNVFIQPDSYHNLPVMNERPLCEDAERSEIKRRVINRPVALNDLRVHAGKNRNESISRTLPVQSVTIYKTPSFSFFFLPFSTSHILLSPYRYSGSRAAGEISLNSSHVLRARLTNSVSLNVSLRNVIAPRRRQKLSAAIIYKCLAKLAGYFGSRVLRKCVARPSPYKSNVVDDR